VRRPPASGPVVASLPSSKDISSNVNSVPLKLTGPVEKPVKSGTTYHAKRKSAEPDTLEKSDEKWKFKCICGEVCSWYEKVSHRPKGKIYECTSCGVWSHVKCMFGKKAKLAQVAKMSVRNDLSLLFSF
jgi:predicted RNA-binding Zn-ribbon protein involved in translation (DUF1610 family)